ncbi:hypothetical protein F4821DRAFT_259201 [Hypoxylon rubiginosum]|uniref:Uncharacterized protein n=1 Tax=Hypoxylon rubiginosum TaxID=110542 RepID=A0ACC0D3B9_9PEZI|nr:hypothetical protein F4821DRAFT_259201 [Hypoxylon rubiginosum]
MSNDSDPIEYFGLSCPAGGDFHICQDSRERFIGCCDVDPCADGSGNCPSRSLHAAGFDTTKYNEILVQSCESPSANWFTCIDGPFMGCCKSNPCANEGTCRAGDLVAGMLSNDARNANIFITSSASPSSTRSSSTSPTSSAIATSTPVDQEDTSNTPVAKIVGGTVGGVAGLILILCFIILYMRRRTADAREKHAADAREKQSASATNDQTTASSPPWSPYKDSYAGSPSIQQGAPSPALPSPSLTNNGRASVVSELSSAPWDSRHASYTTASPPMSSHHWAGGAGQQQPHPTSLNPVSELDGSGLTQYHELDAGPLPPQELHSTVK